MQLKLSKLETNQCYHLLTQVIVPRPIAWVLSENADASLNLAPFSFFNAVCSNPPMVMLSISHKPDSTGAYKDTYTNLISGREFVIHLPSVAQAADVTASATTLAYGTSELDLLAQQELVEFPDCPLPRLKHVPVAFHAVFEQVHYLGPDKQAVIYARLEQVYIQDAVVEVDEARKRLTIDAEKLAPLARLGGANYSGLGQAFSFARPK